MELVHAPLRSGLLKKSLPCIGVFVILLLGVFLRLHLIDEPVRLDEGFSLLHYAPNPPSLIAQDYSFPNNHFLHSMAQHVAYSWFGFSEWAMRGPAFAAGVLVLFLMAVFAWEIMRDPWAVLFTVLLGAASFSLIYYSVNGRGYSMQMMFTLLLAMTLWRAGQWRSEGLGLLAVSGLLWALLYTIPSGIVVALPLGIAFMGWVAYQRSPRMAGKMGLVVLVSGLALVAAFGPGLRAFIKTGLDQPAMPRLPVIMSAARMASDGALPGIMAVLALGMGLRTLSQRRREAAWLMGAVLFGYPLLVIIFGFWLPLPVMVERSYTPIFPLAYVVMGCGIAQALQRKRSRTSQVLLPAAALLIMGYGTYSCWAVVKDPSRLYFPERPVMAAGQTLIPALAQSLEKGEVVAGSGILCDMAAAFYVTRTRGFHGFYSLMDPEGRHVKTVYFVAESAEEAHQVWKELSTKSRWTPPKKMEESGPISIFQLKRLLQNNRNR